MSLKGGASSTTQAPIATEAPTDATSLEHQGPPQKPPEIDATLTGETSKSPKAPQKPPQKPPPQKPPATDTTLTGDAARQAAQAMKATLSNC